MTGTGQDIAWQGRAGHGGAKAGEEGGSEESQPLSSNWANDKAVIVMAFGERKESLKRKLVTISANLVKPSPPLSPQFTHTKQHNTTQHNTTQHNREERSTALYASMQSIQLLLVTNGGGGGGGGGGVKARRMWWRIEAGCHAFLSRMARTHTAHDTRHTVFRHPLINSLRGMTSTPPPYRIVTEADLRLTAASDR
ncbi:hypothetical protein TcWFU_004281 [Taenia crassiceps]|uniref:Uncharacterized protein n=1 Tax=Taenia crassiceps TaxID=6207 RepID=A0ABR4Q821_9CEST